MVEAAPFVRGFGLSFGLIAAIGAQNAYLLNRGILRNHHWAVALLCGLLDTLLIACGILGMGKLITAWPDLLNVVTISGAVFLFAYGCFAFRRMSGSDALQATDKRVSLKVALGTVLALSLLNPHVYLDTVILIGSISLQELPADRVDFGIGAACASFVWFFCLSLGGQMLQGVFRSARAWRVLDGIVGITMWVLAAMLIGPLLFSA